MSKLQELVHGAAQFGLEISPEAMQKLLSYLMLLQKWNKVYNLTAIRQPEKIVSHHLLDSLAILPYLWQGHWLDVGSGAGLPGLVLAIMRPDWQFTLLDSNSKKTSFMQQAVIDLELHNVTICCARAEDWQPNEKFDGIVSRAFAEIGDFVAMTRHLLVEGGRWVAMKGLPKEELQQLPTDIEVERIIPLEVPGLDAKRCLVVLKEN